MEPGSERTARSMKKLMLIVNPAAGRGAYEKEIGKTLAVLYDGGCLPTVYFTAGAKDAQRLAAATAEALERQRAVEFEFDLCVPEGKALRVHMKTDCVRDRNSKVEFICTFREA